MPTSDDLEQSDLPLVSIITPSYNQGSFIEDCLKSVSSQTYPKIEHIVLDAESTDETRGVLEHWKSLHNKDFRFFVESDEGQADALNKGFSIASGKVLCWLNSDDFYLTTTVIEEAIKYLNAYGCDIVTGSGYMVRPNKTWIRPLQLDANFYQRRFLEIVDPFLQPATFWKRAIHRPLEIEYSYVFDWILFREMLRNEASCLVVDDAWAAYREHDLSKTAMDNSQRKFEIAKVYRDSFGRFNRHYLWGMCLAFAYLASERTGTQILRNVTEFFTKALRAFTGFRIQP